MNDGLAGSDLVYDAYNVDIEPAALVLCERRR